MSSDKPHPLPNVRRIDPFQPQNSQGIGYFVRGDFDHAQLQELERRLYIEGIKNLKMELANRIAPTLKVRSNPPDTLRNNTTFTALQAALRPQLYTAIGIPRPLLSHYAFFVECRLLGRITHKELRTLSLKAREAGGILSVKAQIDNNNMSLLIHGQGSWQAEERNFKEKLANEARIALTVLR